MRYPFELTQQTESLLSDTKCHLDDLLSTLPCEADEVLIRPENGVILIDKPQDYILVLSEGLLSLFIDERNLVIYEEGDLIHSNAFTHLTEQSLHFQSDFTVRIKRFKKTDFFNALAAHSALETWYDYQTKILTVFELIIANYLNSNDEKPPEMKFFEPGVTIIEAGTDANEVYTLLEGHADVYVNNILVGEILRDEIFGTLAALTNSTRTASVIARKRCMVIVSPTEAFTNLIQTRPNTVFKLVEDMARQIKALNEQVVKLTAENKSED